MIQPSTARRAPTGLFTAGGTYARRVPLTLSHPAAVLPLRRLGLPMTALVLGSMTPDAPLYAGWTRAYEITHSVVGVLTVDVVATTLVVGVWFAFVRDALVDLAPPAIRSRLAPRARLTARQWRLTPRAAVIGASTHVVWDAFTHPGRWGPRHLPWLRADHLGLAGMTWAQYVSGVLGLLVVGWAVVAHLRSLPPTDARLPAPALTPAALIAALAAAALAGLVSALLEVSSGLHSMAYHGVVNSLIVLVLGLVCVCMAWHLSGRPETR